MISRAAQERLRRSEDYSLALGHRTQQLLNYTHHHVRDAQADTEAKLQQILAAKVHARQQAFDEQLQGALQGHTNG
ncbi:hypothetical protein PC116_g5285 [Phytophthora cactorum]|nr:hypothetical protein PC114_g6354 [Phytophthora cactorum]KAG3114593.1 hypothetical protein PI125_g6290 [Phytophthora idaei]KAG3033879.1 hypothetical protein PC119_g5108 [Phytophthora cactorum]KAG3184839.1 hypothetical protein C6341_g4736 [Phytophthora cactorum]KAG3201724.1 hypothetical protein PC128_g3710 [Phytophthora cactorum]